MANKDSFKKATAEVATAAKTTSLNKGTRKVFQVMPQFAKRKMNIALDMQNEKSAA